MILSLHLHWFHCICTDHLQKLFIENNNMFCSCENNSLKGKEKKSKGRQSFLFPVDIVDKSMSQMYPEVLWLERESCFNKYFGYNTWSPCEISYFEVSSGKTAKILSPWCAPGDVDRSPISGVMVQENAEG